MKRCPKCNRTFTTDTQKFCTHDGGILEGVDMQQPDTVRMDSAPFDNDDAPTKVISAETVIGTKPDFDPFKTVISSPAATTVDKLNDTQGSLPRATTAIPAAQSPSAPLPGSGQISQPPPQSPAPPPPRQSSPSAPTMALTGTAPIMTASLPSPPPPITQQSPQPSAAPPVKKKSRLPLVLGILAVLFVFGGAALGAVYWFVARPMLAKRRVVAIDVSRPPTQAPTPNIEATPGEVPKTVPVVVPEPPAYTPPADAVQFENSKENLNGQLAEHYVDFSFYYPESWQKNSTAGVPGARNFAQVERRLPPDFTQEQFAVAWNSSSAPVSENHALFHTLSETLFKQFKSQFAGYRKVSEGETKAGPYDGYEFRFEGISKDTAKGDVKLWGRVIFLPPQGGGKDGVTLLMLATSLAPELKGLDDVGVKGDLPMMLKSFRFGKK